MSYIRTYRGEKKIGDIPSRSSCVVELPIHDHHLHLVSILLLLEEQVVVVEISMLEIDSSSVLGCTAFGTHGP